MSNMYVLAMMLAAAVGVVRSHSWLACVDYTEKDAADWDPDKCRGFARDSHQYAQKASFGTDRGFDHKPGNAGKACKTNLGVMNTAAASYTSEYPMAVYYPGQQVILVHPMKNHGATSCTNKFIPDHGNWIYRGVANGDVHETYTYYKNAFLVADLGRSRYGNDFPDSLVDVYPKPGFQNAPKFCENTDKALATYSFNVPSDLAAGLYTFVWAWAFNGATDIYTGCFDVHVTADKAARDAMLTARDGEAAVNLWVACGGTTSAEEEGSTVGCDTTTSTPASTTPTTQPPPSTTTVITAAPTPAPSSTAAPTPAPTQTPGEGQRDISLFQMSGVIDIGEPAPGTSPVRRFVRVDFGCDADASFWNGRVTERDGGEYRLVQEEADHVTSGDLFFSATYSDACDLREGNPRAHLIRDEDAGAQ